MKTNRFTKYQQITVFDAVVIKLSDTFFTHTSKDKSKI